MSIKCPKARAAEIPSGFDSIFCCSCTRTHTRTHTQASTSRLSSRKPKSIRYWICRIHRIKSENKLNLLTSSVCARLHLVYRLRMSTNMSIVNANRKFTKQHNNIQLICSNAKRNAFCSHWLCMTSWWACKMHPLQPRSQNIATKQTESKSILNLKQ